MRWEELLVVPWVVAGAWWLTGRAGRGWWAVFMAGLVVVTGAVMTGAVPAVAQRIFGSKTLLGKPALPAEEPIKPEGTATTVTEVVDGKNENAGEQSQQERIAAERNVKRQQRKNRQQSDHNDVAKREAHRPATGKSPRGFTTSTNAISA